MTDCGHMRRQSNRDFRYTDDRPTEISGHFSLCSFVVWILGSV